MRVPEATIEKMVRSIYAVWHQCKLKPKDARAIGHPSWKLCDTCEGCIKAHMDRLKEEARAF